MTPHIRTYTAVHVDILSMVIRMSIEMRNWVNYEEIVFHCTEWEHAASPPAIDCVCTRKRTCLAWSLSLRVEIIVCFRVFSLWGIPSSAWSSVLSLWCPWLSLRGNQGSLVLATNLRCSRCCLLNNHLMHVCSNQAIALDSAKTDGGHYRCIQTKTM